MKSSRLKEEDTNIEENIIKDVRNLFRFLKKEMQRYQKSF